MEVVRDRVVVDLAERPLLGAQRTGEVAEVVDGQGEVSGQGLPDRLAVVPALGDRQLLQMSLHPVGDPVEDQGALARRGRSPRGGRGVCRVQGPFDVLGSAAGDLGEGTAVDGTGVLEVLATGGRDVRAADPVVVAGLVRDDGALGARRSVTGHLCGLPDPVPPAVGRPSGRG